MTNDKFSLGIASTFTRRVTPDRKSDVSGYHSLGITVHPGGSYSRGDANESSALATFVKRFASGSLYKLSRCGDKIV